MIIAAHSCRRSVLFTPANRPNMFSKALVAGADMVCIDLEDAVAPELKDTARSHALGFLAGTDDQSPERIVRINSPRTRAGLKDLSALVDAHPAQGIIMLPKVDSAEEVRWIDSLFCEADLPLGLAAIIETTLGVENAFQIASATPRMSLVMFGGGDLAAELGTRVRPEPLAYGRSRVVYAARHARIDVLDVPCIDYQDLDLVRTEADDARLLGFTGKGVLHPANIEPVNAAFTPTADELEEARRVVDAFHNSSTGIAVVDGRLVEKPIVSAMETTLARGRAAGLIL